MTWKIKKDENGAVVFEDDKPVYIDPDGKELALDPPQMYSKIIDLGKENKSRREELKKATDQLKVFDGIEELTEWKQQADDALEKVKNFNDKDWLKADKVEKLKLEMESSYKEKLDNQQKSFDLKVKEYQDTLTTKDKQIRKLMVSNMFASSPYFSGSNPKTNLPPAIAETYFGKNFKVEEDEQTKELKLVAYHDNGDVVLSRERPGEIAGYDEAMTAIFEASPFKDQLLKSSGRGSGGSGGSDGGDLSPDDEIAALEKAYQEALDKKDGRRAVALKHQIFDAKAKKLRAA